MKPLITTQLIEEYQKHSTYLKEEIRIGNIKGFNTGHLVTEKICIDTFITSLQSKQSEERQNIVDAFEYGSIKGAKGIEMDGESYLNDNFKIKNK